MSIVVYCAPDTDLFNNSPTDHQGLDVSTLSDCHHQLAGPYRQRLQGASQDWVKLFAHIAFCSQLSSSHVELLCGTDSPHHHHHHLPDPRPPHSCFPQHPRPPRPLHPLSHQHPHQSASMTSPLQEWLASLYWRNGSDSEPIPSCPLGLPLFLEPL